MGSIIRKKIKGITYYYYVESKRIDGKPKLVNQKYLGNADKLLEKVVLSETPLLLCDLNKQSETAEMRQNKINKLNFITIEYRRTQRRIFIADMIQFNL